MATKKVSALTALTSPDGSEELLVNDGGTSKKITIANLLYDESIDSDHYVDGSIDNAHLADDAVDSDELAAGAVDLAHMSSESVDEDNLYISNAGSDGQYLQKQSGNSGGLTWATASANTPSSADGQALGSASLEWSDLFLADGGTVTFGNDQEIILTHVADTGLTLKHTATADDKPVSITLQTGETDIAANDVIGKIDFQAPDEGTGTDAILVAAGIEAVSEGDFSATSNATKLSFKTASSEAAAEKASLSSVGNFTISGAIWENGRTIAADYTISSSHNAMSCGPITVNSGVSVTVPSGSVWAII